jgi:hypothetical protein
MTNYAPIAGGIVASPFLQSLDLPAAMHDQTRAAPFQGMVNSTVRALLHELVRRTWRGEGAIIDGGSFLGSSLVAMATGLAANPRSPAVHLDDFPGGKPIHGYELGFLPAPENESADRRRVYGNVEYRLGDSFVPILQDNVAPYREFVELHIGDLVEQTWDGSPIEIAFIDVCKTPDLNSHVARQFYPALISGSSTLINADFFFDRLPWIKVTMGYLSEYFQWEGKVSMGSIYSSVKAVPQDVANYDPFTEGSFDECLAYHDAVEFPGTDRRSDYYMALSRAYMMALKSRKEQALEYLRVIAYEFAELLLDDDEPHGNQFRLERAVRQISRDAVLRAGA